MRKRSSSLKQGRLLPQSRSEVPARGPWSPDLTNDAANPERTAGALGGEPPADPNLAPAEGTRQCPTRADGAETLIAHTITLTECQARQRNHYHKCPRCTHYNARTAFVPRTALGPLTKTGFHALADADSRPDAGREAAESEGETSAAR